MISPMEVLVSDIVGLFNREEGVFVRIKRPDRTFVEGLLAPQDVSAFAGRLRTARATDDSAEFDVSMLTNLQVAE